MKHHYQLNNSKNIFIALQIAALLDLTFVVIHMSIYLNFSAKYAKFSICWLLIPGRYYVGSPACIEVCIHLGPGKVKFHCGTCLLWKLTVHTTLVYRKHPYVLDHAFGYIACSRAVDCSFCLPLHALIKLTLHIVCIRFSVYYHRNKNKTKTSLILILL